MLPLRQPSIRPPLPIILVAALLALLWIAGGASREDALGQTVVRAGTWLIIAIAALAGPRPAFSDMRPVMWLLLAIAALPLVQLVPLPPELWQALPGREMLVLPGETSPWRPWTMTPGATRNALASLVVPGAMLLVLAQTSDKAREWLPSILLGTIASAVLLGLLQFSGGRFNNPLINDVAGNVSSIFANRNHFALFIAIGCLLAPVWAFDKREGLQWRGPVAAGLVLLFILTILAVGSRSGLLLTGLALILALAIVGNRLKQRLQRLPRWLFFGLAGMTVLVVGGFIWASFEADRVEAIDRLLATTIDEDLRTRARPTILAMIATYFPFGSGMGGFDPVFRIHEPASLLAFQYLNQAHNDYLGIALDGGLPGLAIVTAAICWWAFATFKAWRAPSGAGARLGRLGSGIILLMLVASITDYPVRTPMMMAVAVLAAMWLALGSRATDRVTLPQRAADL